MTFEEIHDQIISGGRPETLKEAEESLVKLVAYGTRTPQMTALRLAESKKLYGRDDRHWVRWAMTKFNFKSENDTQHRRAVGDMLCALRDEDFTLFKRFLSTDFSKLYELTEIHQNRPLPTLINFIKLYFPDDDVKRDDLRLEKAKLLGKAVPESQTESETKTESQAQPVQQEFDFVQRIASREICADAIAAQPIRPPQAIMMGVNGAALCQAAVQKLTETGGVPLEIVLQLEARLRSAADQLRRMAAATADQIQE